MVAESMPPTALSVEEGFMRMMVWFGDDWAPAGHGSWGGVVVIIGCGRSVCFVDVVVPKRGKQVMGGEANNFPVNVTYNRNHYLKRSTLEIRVITQ